MKKLFILLAVMGGLMFAGTQTSKANHWRVLGYGGGDAGEATSPRTITATARIIARMRAVITEGITPTPGVAPIRTMTPATGTVATGTVTLPVTPWVGVVESVASIFGNDCFRGR